MNVAAKGDNASIPPAAAWKLTPGAKYVHYCDNETIQGVEFRGAPGAWPAASFTLTLGAAGLFPMQCSAMRPICGAICTSHTNLLACMKYRTGMTTNPPLVGMTRLKGLLVLLAGAWQLFRS